jgi:hypothetical protein
MHNICVFSVSDKNEKQNNSTLFTMDGTNGAGTAYLFGAPESTPSFS